MSNEQVRSYFHPCDVGDIFYTLVGNPSDSKKFVVYFAPLFEERMWSQRIAYNFALELANNGYCTVIHDYPGYGESAGDTEDFSVSKACSSTQAILNSLKEKYQVDEISLWGVRTGCAVALAYYSQRENVSNLVLWSAVFQLKTYIYRAMMSNIATQASVFKKNLVTRDSIIEELLEEGRCVRMGYTMNQVDGYLIGADFYNEVLQFEQNGLNAEPAVNTLSIAVCKHEKQVERANRADDSSRSIDGVKFNALTQHNVVAQQFWLNNKLYSQTSKPLYIPTILWLKSINKETTFDE